MRRQEKEHFLRHQSLQVLLCLLEHHDQLVTKEMLTARIWHDTAVTDNALAQCIAEIRKAIQDDSRNSRYIRTISKAGYCFVAPIREQQQLVEQMPIPVDALATLPIQEPEAQVIVAASSIDSSRPRWSNFVYLEKSRVRRLIPAILPRVTPWFLSLSCLLLLAAIWLIKWHSKPLAVEATMGSLNSHNLAVMYFENESGRPEMDWLCQGLTDMIITDMSRSSLLHVLSRQQLSILVPNSEGKQGSPVPFDQALQIAHVTHAANVLLGSFSAIDGNIRIDVQLHDASNGQIILADHVVFPENTNLLSQIDILAGRLLTTLESRASVQPNLSEVTTGNVEAYRYYSLGVEKSQELENNAAIGLLKQATEFDPQFAMAWARIGYTYALADIAPDKGRPYLEKALKLSKHLTEKDRLYVNAWYAISRHDYDQAAQTFRQIMQLYPQETEACWRLARLLRGSERSAEALQVLNQGLALNPNDKNLYNTKGLILLSLHRYSEAIDAYKQYIDADPNGPNAHDSLGMAYEQSGNYDAAYAEYNRALVLDPEFEPSIIHLGDVYFQTGQYRNAAYQYLRYVKVAQTSNARAFGYGNLATVYLAMNDLPKAEEAAANELRNNPHAVWNSLLIALRKVNQPSAASFEQTLFRDIPTQERGVKGDQRTRYYYQGYIDMQRGKTEQALTDFQTALQHLPPSSGMDLYEDCVANTQLKLGHYTEAIAEYNRILAFNPNYPLAHYHLAQAYVHQGNTPRAVSEYKIFLQTWRSADANDPAVVEARQTLASNGASPIPVSTASASGSW